MITGAPVNVMDFGAVGDGVANDTAAIVAAAATLQDNQILYFPAGVYLVSAANAVAHQSGAAYGKVVLALTSLSNISIQADSATIKVVNHNCSTGGLTFANFKSCQNVNISGFNFEMTFTGVNTSASLYPFCGAITGIDSDAAGQTQTELNGDFLITNCTFNLFHPFGQYAQSGAPFSGDPNNGYKVFSIYVSGPYLATDYDEQSRNITVENCGTKDGHNAYGFWFWSWNNVVVKNCFAENYVGKYSNASGTILGDGVGFIRYHQFHCSGILIDGCNFLSKPCNERTVSGYEGGSIFTALDTNLTGDFSNGNSIVSNNTIVLGNGDFANSFTDYGVFITLFGNVNIENNLFDGIATTSNAYVGIHVYFAAFSTGGNGKASLLVNGNTFGKFSSYIDSIRIANGSDISEYARRIKQIEVTNNISGSQLQYFYDIDSTGTFTYTGCRNTVIQGNIIDGTFNTVFNSSNSNSRAINYITTESTDQATISTNQIRNKHTAMISTGGAANSPSLINNLLSGVTLSSLSGLLWSVVTGSPEGAVVAKVGSLVTRTDGGATTTLYVKESGTGNTGWVAK
jgi:hypothetical protein